MQAPTSLLSVVTFPVGAGLGRRIVIDGPRGAIFQYDNTNALVGWWASAAGTDPYGHAYTQGFSVTGSVSGSNFDFSNAGFFLYSPTKALGNLIYSVAPAAGTDPYGNVYRKGAVTYGGTNRVQMDAGTVNFFTTTSNADGHIQDFGGTLNLQSIKSTAADVAAAGTFQSKLNTNDGLHPEFVLFQRMQIQDEAGNPSGVVSVDPASPNTDESAHAWPLTNSWTQAAARPLCTYHLNAGVSAFSSLINNVGLSVHLQGSVVVPNPVPAFGTALTTALPAAYRPNHNTSILFVNINTAGIIRGILGTGGTIQWNQQLAGAAPAIGDILELIAIDIYLEN